MYCFRESRIPSPDFCQCIRYSALCFQIEIIICVLERILKRTFVILGLIHLLTRLSAVYQCCRVSVNIFVERVKRSGIDICVEENGQNEDVP